ncbi:hypothetical protein FVEN_g12534 [Fusarium venenatum]|nr:hypothetical protein FVEN_g12534 [Fusarium venenatum]
MALAVAPASTRSHFPSTYLRFFSFCRPSSLLAIDYLVRFGRFFIPPAPLMDFLIKFITGLTAFEELIRVGVRENNTG